MLPNAHWPAVNTCAANVVQATPRSILERVLSCAQLRNSPQWACFLNLIEIQVSASE